MSWYGSIYSGLAWTWRSPTGYNIVSGVLPDITLVGILGWAAGAVRKHTCHVQRCVRIGRHPAGDGKYVVCAKHHPEIGGAPCTPQLVREAHDAHRRRTT